MINTRDSKLHIFISRSKLYFSGPSPIIKTFIDSLFGINVKAFINMSNPFESINRQTDINNGFFESPNGGTNFLADVIDEMATMFGMYLIGFCVLLLRFQ